MCGIVGIYKLDGNTVEPNDLRKMASSIAHRGPDDAGYALLDGGSLGLGNVRLSIMDPELGCQPMFNEDHSVALVFNGEIYDHRDVRADLVKQGHRFRTDSDTEIIVHLYEQYGINMLARLNGEYAFILWDANRKKLFAARDRFGLKPLFYHKRGPQEFLFASEAKGLVCLDRVSKSLSCETVAGAFLALYSDSESILKGIHNVRPGHFIEVDADGGHVERRYWQFDFSRESGITFEAAKEGLRHHLSRAVARRMVADFPVAVYLSGGVDSTIMASLMSRQSTKVKAFTIGFQEKPYDESEVARASASHFGLEFDAVTCSVERLAEVFEDSLFHSETIVVNPHSAAKQLLSQHVRSKSYKVCITGEGADECFAGYPYYRLQKIWGMFLDDRDQRRPKELLKKFMKEEKHTEVMMWDRTRGWKLRSDLLPLPSYFLSRAKRNSPKLRWMFNPDFMRIHAEDVPSLLLRTNFDLGSLRKMTSFNAARCIGLNQFHSYIVPAMGDRVEMANSVECRIPFLDTEVVDFLETVPSAFLLQPDTLKEKFLLREAFKGFLPPHLSGGRKHTFVSPGWDEFCSTRRGKELCEQYLSERALKEAGIFNCSFVRRTQQLRRVLPTGLSLRKQLNLSAFIVLSMQILWRRLVDTPIPCDPSFPLVDRTPVAASPTGR